MDKLDFIKSAKKKYHLTNKQLSTMSGVPYGTIIKILSGSTKSPGITKLTSLEESIINFIKEEDGALTLDSLDLKPFSKTLDDYYALPEDIRVELIDGVFFDMGTPSTWHQMVIGSLFYKIKNYIDSKKGKCTPFVSPVDVQLDKDNKTMVQPDLIIVCNPELIIDRCIYGAPDFVMEVTSKSSKSRDYILKLNKYRNAGVREYWIFDRDSKQLHVYSNLDNENFAVESYNFNETVPLGIYDDLFIDLNEVIPDM